MKRTSILTVSLLLMVGFAAQAATRIKQDNNTDLNLPGSWDTIPGIGDIAQWDSTVTGANTTVLGAATTWDGLKIVNPGGLVTINADGNTLTLGAAAIDLDMTTASRNLTLNNNISLGAANVWDTLTNRTATVGGSLTGSATLTKQGFGTAVLNGDNSSYSGAISVAGGVLSIGHSSALGTTAVTMSAGTGLGAIYVSGGITVANALNTLNGAAGAGITARGNLRSLSGANTWAGKITPNNSSRIGADTGSTLNITGGIDIGSTRTINFIGDGDINVNSVIARAGSGGSTAIESIQRTLGGGTLTLGGTAANTYDGFTLVADGKLLLDYSGGNVDKLANTTTLSNLRLNGGTLELSGGSYTEVVSSTALQGGAATVTRSSGTSVLRLNAITRSTGGTVNFGAGSIADTDTLNVNGILGGYATVGGSDWAMNSTGGADGAITAYSSYTTDTAPGTWAATENINLTANPASIAANTTINSLRLAGASAVTIDSGMALTIASGGVLATGSSATSIAPASGTATLMGANTLDLVVQQYSSADMTISATIANNTGATRLTKSGPGKLILSGANTYTGSTVVNAGILSVSANNNLGDPVAGASVLFNGGTLEATGTFAFDNGGANARTVTFGDQVTSKIDVTSGNALTVSGTMNGRGWLTKTGTGTLILSGAANTYQGEVTVSAGTLLVNMPGPVVTNAMPVVTVASSATLGGNGIIGVQNVGDNVVNIQNGGTLAPGASVGTFTLNADLNLANLAVLSYELKGNDTTVGGGLNDLTIVNGALTLDGILNVSEIGAGSFLSANVGDKWRLFNYLTDPAYGLTDNGLSIGSMPTLSGGLSFGIETSTPGQVNLVVVPEPSTFALTLLGGFGLLAVYRFRRSA